MIATKWYRWFAWYRVTIDSKPVWFKYVLRRDCENHEKSWSEYTHVVRIPSMEEQLHIRMENLLINFKDLHDRNEELVKELEIERVRLAGCGVIAMSNTREALAQHSTNIHPDYQCASLIDVKNAVQRQIELREQVEKLRTPWRWLAVGRPVINGFAGKVFTSKPVATRRDAELIVAQWKTQGYCKDIFELSVIPIYSDLTEAKVNVSSTTLRFEDCHFDHSAEDSPSKIYLDPLKHEPVK